MTKKKTPQHLHRANDAAVAMQHARVRQAGEVLSPQDDFRTRPTYRVGDGDTPFVPRPGSMDAYKLPSLGLRP